MKVHVFNRNVEHDRQKFQRGESVPEHLIELMAKKGWAEPLPEPAKPVEPVKPGKVK